MNPLFKFKTNIRAAFEDVDAFGLVHNAKYFYYFERGRVEYLRHVVFNEAGKQDIIHFEVAVVEHFCSYRKPAHFDDLLTLFLRISYMKNSSFQFQYTNKQKNNDKIIAVGYTNMVYFDSNLLKPKRIESRIREAVFRFEGDHLGQMIGIPQTEL